MPMAPYLSMLLIWTGMATWTSCLLRFSMIKLPGLRTSAEALFPQSRSFLWMLTVPMMPTRLISIMTETLTYLRPQDLTIRSPGTKTWGAVPLAVSRSSPLRRIWHAPFMRRISTWTAALMLFLLLFRTIKLPGTKTWVAVPFPLRRLSLLRPTVLCPFMLWI